MYKIAVVGDYDSIFGFAALGLDTFAVQTREEAAEKLHQLAQGGFAAAGRRGDDGDGIAHNAAAHHAVKFRNACQQALVTARFHLRKAGNQLLRCCLRRLCATPDLRRFRKGIPFAAIGAFACPFRALISAACTLIDCFDFHSIPSIVSFL